MRDTGVTEAQALVLVGAEPVRDERGVVSDVKLLAPEALGRPRVDVVLAISGTYRDDFPSRIRLLDRAIKLAQASPEPDNPLAADTREAAGRLERGGMSHDEAERAARLRIFGQPPGQYGTQLLYLLPRSGEWKDRAEMAEVYRENMRYAYGEDVWGVQADAPYAAALAGTDAVAHVWSSTMMSPLTNHHVYEYLGGLSMAVEQATGKRPDALVADARDASRSRVRDLAEVVSTEGALRLLNDGWVDEMKKSGYAGAGHVAAYTENLFGWATTVPSSVDAAVFERIERMYLEDEGKHGTRAWFEASSPESLLAVTVTLLESARRGYWKPTAEQRQRLAADYMGQVAKNGPPTGMMGGDNRALEALVREAYEAPGSTVPKAAIDAYEAGLKSARAAANAAGTTLAAGLRAGAEGAPAKGARPVEVEGLAMRRAPSASTATPARGSARAVAAAAVALVVAAFAAGLARGRPRRRAARLDASDRERPPARGDSA
jgi:cobaltochelatase CobN